MTASPSLEGYEKKVCYPAYIGTAVYGYTRRHQYMDIPGGIDIQGAAVDSAGSSADTTTLPPFHALLLMSPSRPIATANLYK